MTHASTLRRLLAGPDILVAPGAYDGLSAALVERAGFGAAYLSGASLAYTRFGRPDLGLVSMTEVADTIAAMRDRVALPLIVDADNGYGNALNVARTVRHFERMGASAIQLEDQQLPKRCGHLPGKRLVGKAEMVAKVRAAVDARANPDTVLLIRTDAIAVEGLEAALERAHAYLEAGADALFIEAPESVAQMERIVREFGARVPLLANMVEGGATPVQSAAQLQELGFSLAIFPGALVRAYTFMAEEFLARLARDGSTAGYRARMLDLAGLNALLGTPELLERSAAYENA
ncbi:oxaloacetate decarboxylase [Massilia oculi]|uniref:Oxaloacetate decarboxylase n=1 Tax=Massilia hydrophila TaxID=3044279 RepID=A0ABS7YCF1_9BURK|nr:oxaloacetate decarboxylase [Massilia oculi]MCA1857372.1 oxaloacetate decarboxylase [Massilia oculi]